ncbi:hypothetical protein QFC22_002369 [Naganishia vaughanmartiniae]|uniref:Uncharacterized protein n=1 Tax=Naganishia vaughanmartiniae TaxID=1424756 RepID=A0ACC2XCI0_9TREE|nr:hypothetical protein QFC22_002369 [Naganishia vaughanmartiniae]
MNPTQQNTVPYIMGSYEYYPEDGNVFAFNTDAASSNYGPNLWFNNPFQAVYINEADTFVFDSNPPLVSVGNNPDEILIDKHYDSHANISSWISTASPIGLDLRTSGVELDYGYVNVDPADIDHGGGHGQQNLGSMACTSNNASLGRFPVNGMVVNHQGSPMHSHFGAMPVISTPHSRVISTSTTNSSCPGSSSTLATPRFDPATHFAPLQYFGEQAPLRKHKIAPLFTPDMPDVFTTMPLAPPPINQTIRSVLPESLPHLPGQSPSVVGYQQTSFSDAPESPANGRSLRSTPSMESLRGSFQQDSGPYTTQALLSPFGSSARESTSMMRTSSAPGSLFNAQLLQETPRHKPRQPSETWTSPFTNTPFVAGRHTNSEVKSINRKPSTKMLYTAEPMTRSATATDFPTSSTPIWFSSLGYNSQPNHITSDLARLPTTTDFHLGVPRENLDGWTSQVPQATPLKASFQAVNAIDNTHTSAFTSIPAARLDLDQPGSASHSVSLQHNDSQYLTVPRGVSTRPTKKLPKRKGASSAVKVTFMNFGPKDAKELTNAVAESGKSKRRRQEDSSSGEDRVETSKRCKTSVSSRL